jgi:hypothetical protein
MEGSVCAGDCDEDGAVTVNEILLLIRIALLGEGAASCPSADASGDGAITVDEIVSAVDAALDGCPSPHPRGSTRPSPLKNGSAVTAMATTPRPAVIRVTGP